VQFNVIDAVLDGCDGDKGLMFPKANPVVVKPQLGAAWITEINKQKNR
jgi:hypothetical protein